MVLAMSINICGPVYAEALPTPEAVAVQEIATESEGLDQEQILPETAPEENAEPESGDTATENGIEPKNTPAPIENTAPANTPSPVENAVPENSATPESGALPEQTPAPEEVPQQEKAVYKDGVILLYTYEQLCAVGSGQGVMTGDAEQMGSGQPAADAEGNAVAYSLDAAYRLAQEIELPSGQIWQLPEDFTGRIAPAQAPQERPVYDPERKAVLVYNPYQLAVMAQEDAAAQPVLDGDGDALTFGVGGLIYPNAEDAGFLTYDPANRYILSASFCSDRPVISTVFSLQGTADPWGRDFTGQVLKEIDGKTYILIGNAEQLRAIGTDAKVYTAVYQAKYNAVKIKWEVDTDTNGNPIMLYGGDADLLASQNGTKDYPFGEAGIDKASGVSTGRCGVNQKTGEIDPNMNIADSGATYSSSADYIIFRDIDLGGANWTPLMFSGTMIGAKAEGAALWNNSAPDDFSSATGLAAGVQRPVIQNITVSQDAPIDPEKMKGVGFFATLSRPGEISSDSLGTSGQVIVRNLELKNIHISNNTQKLDVDISLLGVLLEGLALVVGPLLDGILFLLTVGQVKFETSKMLNDLLNVYATDETVLATGAFAGRVEGNVRIEGCAVSSASVSSVNGLTGGFVGYATGVTQYSILGNIAGDLVQVLEKILGVIPGLGLDDLIEVLLENALPLGSLIPVAYNGPAFTNCTVVNLSGAIGNAETESNGGFAGQMIGTQMVNCRIRDSSYTVSAANFGGGFVGLARDAEIKGMLQDGLGILTAGTTGSLLLRCGVDNWMPENQTTVQGGSYLGGFAGAMANSYTVVCDLTMADTAALSLIGTGSHLGGWAGIGSIGWATDLGKGDTNETTLLGGVTDLLSALLSKGGDATALLSLAGVSPSAIMGCQLNSGAVTVQADGSYAGGFVGNGNGLYLTPSSQTYLNKLTYWKSGQITELPSGEAGRGNSLTGLQSVNARGDYAGGIAGSLGSASVGGLLNDTVGLGEFLGFTVDGFTLTGPEEGLRVTAGRYAGGAFGETVGGDVFRVTVNALAQVTASNYAGGFVGVCGPGDLVHNDGLAIKLLGLDKILQVDGLLSVIPGVKVEFTDCDVTGITSGYTVEATASDTTVAKSYAAGGFAAHCNSAKLNNCHAHALNGVTAADAQGYAGGYVGISRTGGLAELADSEGNLNVGGSLISIENLLGTIDYMIPVYTNCTVTYTDGGGVQADVAGGFAADFQSGKVDNQTRGETDYYAVYNIDHVNGQTYAGGFGGIVKSGALADAGGGISVLGGSGLNINLTQLLNVIEAYVPYVEYAGVKSDNGFRVTATNCGGTGTTSGSAGGFVGYASGAQISTCDVTRLEHTTVTPPDDLEAVEAPSYFDTSSTYAVTGGHYAGGYIGCMDIGSAASVGKGLEVLGGALDLTNVLSALSVVVTTIEHSDVTGGAGGYSVLASGSVEGKIVGHTGGFAGAIYGGHIQNSNAHNFEYIIGQISAGGYVGEMQPGNVANLLDNASILGNLVNLDAALASVLQTFVPTIRNSSTDAVPCGGAVRSQAASDAAIQRGMAGGYVGHNMGGSIWGLNTEPWRSTQPYTGPTSLCKAERVRSVYGAEYAGGFTGFMEAADTANVGGLSVLGGLITVNNILGALSVMYPTQESTAVYGPLANLTVDVWNKWVEFVGQYGGYAFELAQAGTVTDQAGLDAKLAQYIYGFNVVAGRGAQDKLLPNPGGEAGGYVGLMRSGTLTNCMAYDVRQVTARGAAGGYAGRMETGGAANFGSVSILGLDLNIGQLVDLAELFVPAVRNSSVQGYHSGMTVTATGTPAAGDDVGYAGGFVGAAYGAQIQLNDNSLPGQDSWAGSDKYPAPTASCDVRNLRRVTGRSAVGGYAGIVSAASLADVNTNASDGLLQGILNAVIKNASDLVNLLPATYTTIHKATVSPADAAWGFVVDGAYTDSTGAVQYAPYAGGFAGYIQAAALGEAQKDVESPVQNLAVTGLRSVHGGLYAGGFFGLSDVAAVAAVSDTNESGETTNILGQLVNLGSVDALDVLRCYIYHAGVSGVSDGFVVQAHSENREGLLDEKRYTGCAGGFAGGLMNGTIKNSTATNLSTVQGLNYTGGFIGHMGKSGAVDVDSVEALGKLLGATVGAVDLFGSQVFDSGVTGIPAGAVVRATAGMAPIAGGFIGYSDLGRINNSSVDRLKKVTSDQIAGGFIGKTDMNYIVSAQVQSVLLEAVLQIVNELVEALYLGSDQLESIGLIDINLIGLVKVEVLGGGNVLKVELLGLPITVSLSKKADNAEQQTDVAVVTIGDSVIRLPCSEEGVKREDLENVEINLIKGNRTELDGCTVTGVNNGYDVFGGGAAQDMDGSGETGIAGGFVGYNHEGKVSNCQMVLCDVVRGTAKKVGPFTGYNDLKSVYWFNDIAAIESENNQYSVYRPAEPALTSIQAGGSPIGRAATQETVGGIGYNRYVVDHILSFSGVIDNGKEMSVYDTFKAMDGAQESGDSAQRLLLAYVSDAKAVLMRDADSPDNPPTTVPEPGVNADPCSETVDLTIQKIWKDVFNLGATRLESLTIEIYRQKFDAQGTALGEQNLYQTVILTPKDQESAWSAVWSTVLTAPVYEFDDANQNGLRDNGENITAYYVYTAEEQVPDGYTVSYEAYDPSHADDYKLTITNTLRVTMPDTGGMSDGMNVLVGVGILFLALTVRKRRRGGRREA